MALALLGVQPVCRALLRLDAGSLLASIRGGQDIGRLVTGLFPALLAVAALVEVAGGRSLAMAGLLVAPETAGQALVRLLSGAALLLALPWWLDPKSAELGESAGSYAGRLLQRVALAAFWAALVLPAPGELAWAIVMAVLGTLFAYVAMHILSERVTPTLRERDAARLVWVVAFPLATVSLAAAFLSGA